MVQSTTTGPATGPLHERRCPHERTRPLRILQAEDSAGDAELTRIALYEGEVPSELHHVVTG